MNGNQFTMKVAVDATNQAIYVDSKDQKDGFTCTFESFREQVSALRELAKVAQVIVPRDSDLEAANFSTGLKVRRNKLSEHEKLARWVARHQATLFWDASRRDEFGNEAERKRYNEALAKTRLLATSSLKKFQEEAKAKTKQTRVAVLKADEA